jgi:acetyl-CoA acetyltransferase
MSIGDVQVIELHDCFSANELITYEALGMCAEGKAGELIDRGDNTYGAQGRARELRPAPSHVWREQAASGS